MKKKKTIIYIDGFNLYYGAVIGTKYKWLDLMALSNNILGKGYDITGIKYFTAKVLDQRISRKNKRQRASDKQDVYIRALDKVTPNFLTYYGRFTKNIVKMPSANPKLKGRKVPVVKVEEKGSDVNLAVHLLNDAWEDSYEVAMVVSNDSDLGESLRLAKEVHQKEIILVNPNNKAYTTRDLAKHANKVYKIKENIIEESQLPDHIPGTNLHKPEGW